MTESGLVNVGGTQAYLSVPAQYEEDVLANGYVCRKRTWIPCHRDFTRGTHGMLHHEDKPQDCTSVILEIHGVPEDWIHPSDKDADTGGCKIITEDKQGDKMWLKPKYLRRGYLSGYQRAAKEYEGKPCMYCGRADKLDHDKRGRVGEARFHGEAFLCSPCSNPECLEKMAARSKRLTEVEPLTLYHKTSKEIAGFLQDKAHGRMVRGDFFNKTGAAGSGIYFAHTARECSWKAEAAGDEKVTLKCKVKMGTPLEASDEYVVEPSNEMFRHLQNLEPPRDSVILDRSARNGAPPKYPVNPAPIKGTRIEDLAIGEKLHPGYEFVVYSWDQVEVECAVDNDPVPEGCKDGLKDGERVRVA